ncbi:MAG TPA: outer membrane beta-barrel protein [Chitinophagales bacterium]|nr:outer membrane beta-barrel protein [Chitinophagales bacterium]
MKVFCASLIFTSWIGITNAQLAFGPLAGINFSGTIGGESFTNYDRDYGWKAGAMLGIPLSKKYFISAELIADTKSYKYNFVDAYPVNNVVVPSYFYEHLIFGYVEAPVSVQRKFSFGFHAGAGAFAGYQISQRRNETVDYTVEVNSIVTNVTATSSTHDITADRFQFGVQAELGYVKSGFDLSLTSQYHLTPLYNFSIDEPRKLHFFNLTLGLAYQFKLPRKTSQS